MKIISAIRDLFARIRAKFKRQPKTIVVDNDFFTKDVTHSLDSPRLGEGAGFGHYYSEGPSEPLLEDSPNSELLDQDSLSYDELFRPTADNWLVNIAVVWDREQYDGELTLIANAEHPGDQRLLATSHAYSGSHTTFKCFDLMPTQAQIIKGAKGPSRILETALNELIEQLHGEIPELIEGRSFEVIDFWWYGDDDSRQHLRFDPSNEPTGDDA